MFSAALPACQPPFYETVQGSGIFYDAAGRLCNPCDLNYKWSNGECVLDVQVTPPASAPSGLPDKVWLYLGGGLLLLLLVGSFAGGRSAGRSAARRAPRLASRTTTRSVFA